MDSIKKWAQVVGAAESLVKVIHVIATTVGPYIHHIHLEGEQIEISGLIAKAESIKEDSIVEEPTDEAFEHAKKQLAELQASVSAIISQVGAASASASSSAPAERTATSHSASQSQKRFRDAGA